jgi:hypothetical protein
MAKSLDGNLVKKAHAQLRYTLEEVKHLEACMDPVGGPLYFAKNFIKFNTLRGSIPFEPYEYQERLIEAYHDNKQCIAMLPRQMGKTTCAVAYLLWYTLCLFQTVRFLLQHTNTKVLKTSWIGIDSAMRTYPTLSVLGCIHTIEIPLNMITVLEYRQPQQQKIQVVVNLFR